MLFPTITFAVFFLVTFWVAWALEDRLEIRKAALLIASYVFYGWWDWRFCFLLAGTSLIAWISGLLISRASRITTQKTILTITCIMLLGVLGLFKYYGFFTESLQEILYAAGLERDLPLLEVILPVGISFFTFQAISYVVDVYHGQANARRSPLDVLLYISFFPQLVAGPIVRAADFLPQLERPVLFTRPLATFGLTLVALGLFKKMVVANTLATSLVDPVFVDPTAYSAAMLMMSIYGYAVQIYCDFSGYSDIAIGTAALLGFRFRPNFNQPYRAASLRDFWRRWHMSLSQWLRDYLYIPLGGSHHGRWLTMRNIFVTMFLGGLWHGAAWTFVLWGSLHGLWLIGERLLAKNSERPWGILSWFITFHVVCTAWVFFRAGDLSIAIDWFTGLGRIDTVMDGLTWMAVLLIAATMVSQFTPPNLTRRFAKWLEDQLVSLVALLFFAALAITVFLSPAGTSPFIYFQF